MAEAAARLCTANKARRMGYGDGMGVKLNYTSAPMDRVSIGLRRHFRISRKVLLQHKGHGAA